MYLEIYANICISEKSAQFIRKTSKKLAKMVSIKDVKMTEVTYGGGG